MLKRRAHWVGCRRPVVLGLLRDGIRVLADAHTAARARPLPAGVHAEAIEQRARRVACLVTEACAAVETAMPILARAGAVIAAAAAAAAAVRLVVIERAIESAPRPVVRSCTTCTSACHVDDLSEREKHAGSRRAPSTPLDSLSIMLDGAITWGEKVVGDVIWPTRGDNIGVGGLNTGFLLRDMATNHLHIDNSKDKSSASIKYGLRFYTGDQFLTCSALILLQNLRTQPDNVSI